MKELTKAEEQVMQILWDMEKGFVKDLLEKFPAFDPGWTEEIKSKWFDDFRELMKISTDQKLA